MSILTIVVGITASTLADDSLPSGPDDVSLPSGPDNVSLPSGPDYVSRGMERFRQNKVAGSIDDFQRAAELAPRTKPHLWQLGISYYYAREYKLGRQQFELHQTVNRHDVENAAWHFLCVARTGGVESARKELLHIDVARDVRVPMREVYQFYAGLGTKDSVLVAAEKTDTELARMYANLYLGLYYEVAEKTDLARSYLRQAAAAKLKQNYMHDVAKVHLFERKWDR